MICSHTFSGLIIDTTRRKGERDHLFSHRSQASLARQTRICPAFGIIQLLLLFKVQPLVFRRLDRTEEQLRTALSRRHAVAIRMDAVAGALFRFIVYRLSFCPQQASRDLRTQGNRDYGSAARADRRSLVQMTCRAPTLPRPIRPDWTTSRVQAAKVSRIKKREFCLTLCIFVHARARLAECERQRLVAARAFQLIRVVYLGRRPHGFQRRLMWRRQSTAAMQ